MSGSGGWLEVVGVAQDIKYRSLTEDPRPFYYLPLSQSYGPSMTLVVRAAGDPRAMLAPVRQAVAALDPRLPLFDVKTMTEHLGIALFPARLASSVLGAFGLLALLLAAIGLYGVVAYAVSQRTREIGLRIAIGARPVDVLRLVVGQGMRLALIGMMLGMAAALAVTRLITNLLFGLSPTDPVTLLGIALLLALATLLACWLPARRAASVDPMVALRHE
jgi:ABC-type antimicrobial peptide transport system permease subunit